MPQKLNKAGQMQDYIPKGNGDASGEYGTSNGTNKNFTTSDKKSSKANVITENKSVVVENEKAKKERVRKEANEKIQELHKISDRIIEKPTKEDKELFDKKMDEYEKWEKENSEKTIDYREYFKDKIAGKYAKKDNKANVIDGDLSGKKEYQLDSELVKQANSTKAFYEAGDNIQNKLDYYIKEIDNFDLTPEEKKQAKDKLFNLATDSLKSTSKNMSWVRSGRGNFDFKKSDKAWDKEMKDRNTFENYFNELKSNNEKKAKQSQAKTEQEQYIEAYKKANETGALEMTVNGKTYVRSRKTSRTWYEK